jgi:hypothetical protein
MSDEIKTTRALYWDYRVKENLLKGTRQRQKENLEKLPSV